MVTVEARLIKLEAYEARLQKLEVYADEDAKDLEDRLKKVEKLTKNMEDAIKEIPSDLIEHWSEMIAKVKKIHQEDKERKEALQAIWKKLQGIQENMEVEEDINLLKIAVQRGEEEVEGMKLNLVETVKDMRNTRKGTDIDQTDMTLMMRRQR